MAVDIIPKKIEKINKRISPIQDEYIEKYLTEKELNLTATVFTRIPQAYPQYELHIFWSWKAFFVYHDNEMLKENILNCILLMPYGCLLPGALDKRISWKRGLVIGMGTSFVIELLQLITCRGLFEFDDIIHNGVGCMMGAVLGSWCWLRMLKKFKMLRKPHAS